MLVDGIIIGENNGAFQGATATAVIPYITTPSKNAEQGNAIALSDNSFEYTLPPGSIVSFVEQ